MVSPTRNLPPEAEPWGRYVEDTLTQIKFDANKNAQDINSVLSGINGAIALMSKQIEDIAAATAAAAAAASAAASAAAAANAAVADLAGRITVNATAPGFNSGAIAGAGAIQWYTANKASLTLNVPTGKMLITVTCGEASLSGTASGMGATISYAVPTAGIAVGGPEGRNYTTAPAIASPILVSRVVSVTPGVHTVEGIVGAYSFSAGNSVNYNTISLTVEVIV